MPFPVEPTVRFELTKPSAYKADALPIELSWPSFEAHAGHALLWLLGRESLLFSQSCHRLSAPGTATPFRGLHSRPPHVLLNPVYHAFGDEIPFETRFSLSKLAGGGFPPVRSYATRSSNELLLRDSGDKSIASSLGSSTTVAPAAFSKRFMDKP